MRIWELESNHQTPQLLSAAEATLLAVEHNLVSSYTNYLVVMERIDADKPLDLPSVVTVKQMAPPVTTSACLDIPMFSRVQLIDKPLIHERGSSFIETVIGSFRSSKPTSSFDFALNKRMGERNTSVVPSRIAVLVRLGLENEIADVLHQLVRDGADESETVFALLLLLADVGQLAELSAVNLDIVKNLTHRISAERLSDLQSHLREFVAQRA
jgi:hypothetical protein